MRWGSGSRRGAGCWGVGMRCLGRRMRVQLRAQETCHWRQSGRMPKRGSLAHPRLVPQAPDVSWGSGSRRGARCWRVGMRCLGRRMRVQLRAQGTCHWRESGRMPKRDSLAHPLPVSQAPVVSWGSGSHCGAGCEGVGRRCLVLLMRLKLRVQGTHHCRESGRMPKCGSLAHQLPVSQAPVMSWGSGSRYGAGCWGVGERCLGRGVRTQ